MTPPTRPLVSIGLPVYNGTAYLRQALDSLLAQDYERFELIISDNASTDETEFVCRQYANDDPRIRYTRNAQNLGSSANFRRVLALSSGEFFMWASHDDFRAPSFISRCVDALQRNPSAALCYSRFLYVDNDGASMDNVGSPDHLDLSAPNVRDRVINYLGGGALTAVAVYGLFRRDVLCSLKFYDALASDLMLMMQLILKAPCLEVPEILLYRRYPNRNWEEYISGLFPSGVGLQFGLAFSSAVLCWLRTIWRAGLPVYTTIALTWDVLRLVFVQKTTWRTRICTELESRLAAAFWQRRLGHLALLSLPALTYIGLEGRMSAVILPAIKRLRVRNGSPSGFRAT